MMTSFLEKSIMAMSSLLNCYRFTFQLKTVHFSISNNKCVQSADILSEGVIPGSIQVPADGNPVVLMSDAQTTGGYAKIAAVIRSDLGVLAQLNPGDQVSFEVVSLAQTRELYLARQRALQDFDSSGAN
jgi:allophanate hydrolase subunit 2